MIPVNEMIVECEAGRILFSTDKQKLNVDYIYDFLNNSYWAKSIPRATVETSIGNSVCIGIYQAGTQIGFARLVTDGATVGWLADVFVDERFRGQGSSKQLMTFILSFDFVPGLRRIMLATRDAHGLYEQFGFHNPEHPDRLMEIVRPDIYTRQL